MNRTRIKIYLTAIPTMPMPVSQVLAGEDGAKDIIRRIMDGRGFSQTTAACVYATSRDGDLNPLLDVN